MAKNSTVQNEAAVTEEKRVKIKLPRIMGKGHESEYVCVNNETFCIPRGVEVEVPEYVVEQLEHNEEMLEKSYRYSESVKSRNNI